MPTYEIPQDLWRAFFRSFNRENQGKPVTVELRMAEMGCECTMQELPLVGVNIEVADTQPDVIQISAGEGPETCLTHVIDHPSHIRLAEDVANREINVQIEHDDGPTTLIHVHSALVRV